MRFIPAVSLVRIQLQPPPARWSRGLRHRPFTAVTRVRISSGSPRKNRKHFVFPVFSLYIFFQKTDIFFKRQTQAVLRRNEIVKNFRIGFEINRKKISASESCHTAVGAFCRNGHTFYFCTFEFRSQ